jgi:hypothetical protein
MPLLALHRCRRPLVSQTSSHRRRYHPLRLRCRRRSLPYHALPALSPTWIQEDRAHSGWYGWVLVPAQLVHRTREASPETIDTLEACRETVEGNQLRCLCCRSRLDLAQVSFAPRISDGLELNLSRYFPSYFTPFWFANDFAITNGLPSHIATYSTTVSTHVTVIKPCRRTHEMLAVTVP